MSTIVAIKSYLFYLVLVIGLGSCIGLTRKDGFLHNEPLNIVMHSCFGGRSHIKGALELGQILIKRGHSVEYVAFEDNIGFAKGYNVTTFSLGLIDIELSNLQNSLTKQLSESKQGLTSKITSTFSEVLKLLYIETFEPLSSYLDFKKPDLLVCDSLSEACSNLAKLRGIPLVVYLQTTDVFGLSSAPYITTTMEYGPLTIESMSFTERFIASFFEPLLKASQIMSFIKYKTEISKLYNLPKSRSLLAGLDYGIGIANTFVGLEVPVPIQPNIFQVGPILSPSLNKLDQELDQFLSQHNKVMFIAFGSNIKLPKEEATKIIEAVIISLNQGAINGLIWGLGLTKIDDFSKEIEVDGTKIETKDLFEGKFEGVKLMNWAPQQAILNHPNTKLFISHGGIESTLEGIHSATPILYFPFLADQPRNAAKLEKIGIGQYVNRFDSTPSSIANSISHIIKDESGLIQTHLNRLEVISSFNSKRIHLATDIIESHAYTAKACRPGLPYNLNANSPPCETSHLVTADTRMSWVKSNLVDIYLTALIIVVFIVGLIIYLLTRIIVFGYNWICRKRTFQVKEKSS